MFQNRTQAGRLLAEELKHLKSKNIVVLAIPRGGVVVGAEIAKALNSPLDIIVTKKIGVPGNPELAIGAMGPEGVVVWDKGLLNRLSLSTSDLAPQVKSAKLKVQSYSSKFKIKEKNLSGKTVILTDDGIATGATTQAALEYIKTKQPKKLILAIPVAPPETVKKLKSQVDEFICLLTPALFWAVGQFYQEFDQVEDNEVVRILGTTSHP